MVSVYETAYPRLKSNSSTRELQDIYTPNTEEIAFAHESTKKDKTYLLFLVTLKTFQRLGYFIDPTEIPMSIAQYIARQGGSEITTEELAQYKDSASQTRHREDIRAFLGVQRYHKASTGAMLSAFLVEAAIARDDVADLINLAVEELSRQRTELPAFGTLVKMATAAQVEAARLLYERVYDALGEKNREQLSRLWHESEEKPSLWEKVKTEPGKPTLTAMKEWLDRYDWLRQFPIDTQAMALIPEVKAVEFAVAARALHVDEIGAIENTPRQYTLALALWAAQVAQTLDDLGELYVKRVMNMLFGAKELFTQYQHTQRVQIDGLIETLRDVLTAQQTVGTDDLRMDAIDRAVGENGPELLARCEAHVNKVEGDFRPWLLGFYRSARPTLFRFFMTVPIQSASRDNTLVKAFDFLRALQPRQADFVQVARIRHRGKPKEVRIPLVDLSWIPDSWWFLVTGQRQRGPIPEKVNRRYFELCAFIQIMWQFKSGDLYIEKGDVYGDQWARLISWEDYDKTVQEYGERLGFPVEGWAFAGHVRKWVAETAQHADETFPDNETVRLEKGRPVVQRQSAPKPPAELADFEHLLSERRTPVSLLEVLWDVEQWLHLTRSFGPLSGFRGKLKNPALSYIATVFCYGSQMGPVQTARALAKAFKDKLKLDRFHLARIDRYHISEEDLEKALDIVLKAYRRCEITHFWGTGKRASADGTKWDLYEQNLLSEYHKRYGGYGGIGYYHVADTYIALFSHFITCGTWEGIYLFDSLENADPDIQPDTLHTDTHGQNEVIFGLAYLLGIKLMPHIRRWKYLIFYRPDITTHYKHLDELFTDTTDWALVATHVRDMLRVVLSIKAGRIKPSTFLRRLSSYSRRNALYQAFRELGRAVRTAFLLEYLSDPELRRIIRGATNRSESFNNFTKRVAYGGGGVIDKNDRVAQRKAIKYNHLAANCLILHNAATTTHTLHQLVDEGRILDPKLITLISPYVTDHMGWFGSYQLDSDRTVPAFTYTMPPIKAS
jgi:TnpA family transposase